MSVKHICLKYVKDIYELVQRAGKCKEPVYVSQGRTTVAASSLMGVLTINLSEQFTITYPPEEKEFEYYISQFEC